MYYGNIREWLVSFIGYTGDHYFYNFVSHDKDGKIKTTMCLNDEVSQKKFMTKEEAEELLKRLDKD